MKRLLIAAAAALLLATSAHAGQTCEQKQPLAADVERSLDLALRVARRLDASGARVVVLARAGQDLSRYGPALVAPGLCLPRRQRRAATLARAAQAQRLRQRQRRAVPPGPGRVLLGRPARVQRRLCRAHAGAAGAAAAAAAGQPARGAADEPRYNMVAYPWAQTYQQSNQWAIETLAMAQEPSINSRERAQAWLRFQDYRPTTLRINALTRLGARVGQVNIAFDDHPNERRYSDRIDTVTVDSVFAWLQRTGLASPVSVLR
jgi:hypothetical protein